MDEETTIIAPNRYALWLLPRGDAAHRLHCCIQHLALRFYAPTFFPHLTLCSGIHPQHLNAVIAQCAYNAPKIQPLALALTTLGGTDDFYRCLFLHVQENEPLQSLHACAQQWAGQQQLWVPHISLLYADMPPDTKAAIMGELAVYCHTVAECATLALYDTTGTVEQWREVVSWELG